MLFRQMTVKDYHKVYALWCNTAGMGLNDVDDSIDGITRMLIRNPTLSFVALIKGEIVGVIMAGEDGRRGYIYHTTVLESLRGQGIGQQLVENVLNELKNLHISKVGLFIFEHNTIGNQFWERLGFTVREDLLYRNQALINLVRMDT